MPGAQLSCTGTTLLDFQMPGVFRYLIWPIRCMYIIYHNIFLVCAQKCLSHATAWSWNAFHRVETDVIGLPANLLFLCWHSFWDPDSIANSEVHWNTDSCGSLKRWNVWVLIPCSAIAGVRCFGWSSWFLFICLLPSSSFASRSHGAEVFASCCWFSIVCFVFHCKDHTKWGRWCFVPLFLKLCYCVRYKSQKPNQTFFVIFVSCFLFVFVSHNFSELVQVTPTPSSTWWDRCSTARLCVTSFHQEILNGGVFL